MEQIKSFLSNFIDGFNDICNELFQAIIILLPYSPFHDFELNPIFTDFLGYLNYYIPFDKLLQIMAAWLGCIVIYYTYQLILRHLKVAK